MNLAQRITVVLALFLMAFITFMNLYTGDMYPDEYMTLLLFVAFIAAGFFFLFGIKRKKKKE